jgi:KDO2-lipid IV(A) lauroyltransferase
VRRLLYAPFYALLRFLEAFVRASPPGVVAGGGRLLGTIWWALDARRRFRVRENLRVLRTATGPAARLPSVAEVFRAMAAVPVEALFAGRVLRGSAARRRFRLAGDWDAFAADGRAGHPVVVVTGHLGNWEVGARCLQQVHPRIAAIVRPLGVPALDDFVSRMRGGTSMVLPKRGAVGGALERLRSGGAIALLADQDAGRRGEFVPFFGLPASTSPIPAVLALRGGASLYAGTCIRLQDPITFEVRLRRIHDPRDGGPRPSSADLTAASTQVIEAWIAEVPGQYNWLHRRWKSRPPSEPAQAGIPAYARVSGAHA